MWADMAISGGLSLLRNGMAYANAKKDAAAKERWREYKNSMLNLANANNQNSLTTNENMARERSSEAAFQIERSEYVTLGQAEVSAAASGTGGRSVNMVMFDIERNAHNAQAARVNDLDSQYMQIDNQRQSSAFQAATQMDYSPIPQPSAATAMLGFATDIGKLYSDYNKTNKK